TSLNPQLDPHLSVWQSQTVSHSRHRYRVSVPPWLGRRPSLAMYLWGSTCPGRVATSAHAAHIVAVESDVFLPFLSRCVIIGLLDVAFCGLASGGASESLKAPSSTPEIARQRRWPR